MEHDETTAISTVLTREHHTIADQFKQMVIELLSRESKITRYGVDSSTWTDSETLALEVGHNMTLQVSLSRSK